MSRSAVPFALPVATLVVTLAATVVGSGAARAAVTVQTSVAVLKTEVDGGAEPGIAAQITAKIAEVLQRRPATTVLSADDVSAVLQHEADKQLLGCSEDGCLAELAAALGADVIVSSKVSRIADGWAVSLTAIDAKRATVKARVQETWKGESILLLSLVAPAVEKLLAPDPSALSGTLDVVGAVDGTKIFIDDAIRGTAPAGQMAGVPIGSRRVKLIADGYEPLETYVVVESGKPATLPAQQQLLPEPFYTTWWFWTAAGAGTLIAAAAGTTVAVVALTQGGPGGGGPAGKTGVNVSVNADDALAGAR